VEIAAIKPSELRGILQYVPRFRDRTFVIALDGAVVEAGRLRALLTDVAVLRSLNVKVVIVHGAAAQIRRLAAAEGRTVSNADGSGPADEPTLELAVRAANQVAHEILSGLSAQGLRAAVPNALHARPIGIVKGVDYRRAGRVERADGALLHSLLDHQIIPVLLPLGFDGEGRVLRLNSDAVAVAVSRVLSAVKIVYVTPYDGLRAGRTLLRHIPAEELEKLLEADARLLLPEEARPKARCAVEACKAGVPRVHIINGLLEEALLAEVFSPEGIGTLICTADYEKIRPAARADAPAIYRLIRPAMGKEELMRRTRAEIERQIEDFFVMEADRRPIACVAFHPYPELRLGEVACLCVHPAHENQGVAGRLLRHVERLARERGFTRLIALSTQAYAYFEEKAGFREGRLTDLPEERKERYLRAARRSKILVKDL